MITHLTTALALAATLAMPTPPDGRRPVAQSPAPTVDVRRAITSEVQLAARQERRSLPAAAQQKPTRQRNPALGLLGTVVGGWAGLTAGFVIGAVTGGPCDNNDPGCPQASSGALLGGIVGAILGGIYMFR